MPVCDISGCAIEAQSADHACDACERPIHSACFVTKNAIGDAFDGIFFCGLDGTCATAKAGIVAPANADDTGVGGRKAVCAAGASCTRRNTKDGINCVKKNLAHCSHKFHALCVGHSCGICVMAQDVPIDLAASAAEAPGAPKTAVVGAVASTNEPIDLALPAAEAPGAPKTAVVGAVASTTTPIDLARMESKVPEAPNTAVAGGVASTNVEANTTAANTSAAKDEAATADTSAKTTAIKPPAPVVASPRPVLDRSRPSTRSGSRRRALTALAAPAGGVESPAPTATAVFDDVSLHKAVGTSIRDVLTKEVLSPAFSALLGKSSVTPAANAAVKATLKAELSETVKSTLASAEARGAKSIADSLAPQLQKATQAIEEVTAGLVAGWKLGAPPTGSKAKTGKKGTTKKASEPVMDASLASLAKLITGDVANAANERSSKDLAAATSALAANIAGAKADFVEECNTQLTSQSQADRTAILAGVKEHTEAFLPDLLRQWTAYVASSVMGALKPILVDLVEDVDDIKNLVRQRNFESDTTEEEHSENRRFVPDRSKNLVRKRNFESDTTEEEHSENRRFVPDRRKSGLSQSSRGSSSRGLRNYDMNAHQGAGMGGSTPATPTASQTGEAAILPAAGGFSYSPHGGAMTLQSQGAPPLFPPPGAAPIFQPHRASSTPGFPPQGPPPPFGAYPPYM